VGVNKEPDTKKLNSSNNHMSLEEETKLQKGIWPRIQKSIVALRDPEQRSLLSYAQTLAHGNHEIVSVCYFDQKVHGNLLHSNI
jgi:hypothetical protein